MGSRPPAGKTSLPALLAAKTDSPSAEISSLPSQIATSDSKAHLRETRRKTSAHLRLNFWTLSLSSVDNREIGGQSLQSDDAQDGELSAHVAATYISHCFDTVDKLIDFLDKAQTECDHSCRAELNAAHSCVT